MRDNILKLLRSKNPLMAAGGIVIVLGSIAYGAFVVTARYNEYVSRFETKEDHKIDIEQKVDLFKKDVRIAILENNKVLLDELERRHKR